MPKLITFKDFWGAYDKSSDPDNEYGKTSLNDIRNTLFNEDDVSTQDGANLLTKYKIKSKKSNPKDTTPQGPYNHNNNLGGTEISQNGGENQ